MNTPDLLAINPIPSQDYTRKRWLILALLSVEIETLVVNENPLDTRESIGALLTSRNLGTMQPMQQELGKHFEDAMKFLEDIRMRHSPKMLREYTRNAWEVSPTLAIYLPQR